MLHRSTQPSIIPNPFFIIGSGRNGSTLLAALLNNHPEIFIPPEQHALPYSQMEWYLNPFRSREQKAERLIRRLGSEKHTSNWDLDKEQIFPNITDWSKGLWSELVNRIYRSYGQQLKLGENFIWGDKTPLNTHFIPLLWNDFTSAKYIFLVRDPRDVVLSYSKISSHPASKIDYAIWKWKDSFNQYEYLKKKRADLFLVHYHELVEQPARTVESLLGFLGKPFQSGLLDPTKNVKQLGVERATHHQNLKRGISSTSVGRWKYELSENAVRLVEQRCAQEMKILGYELKKAKTK